MELVILLDVIEDGEVFWATVMLLLTKGCVVVVVVGIVEIGLTSISSVVIGLTVLIVLVDFIG